VLPTASPSSKPQPSTPIAQRQIGTEAFGYSGTVASSLPAPSSPGSLLIASLANTDLSGFTAPPGWKQAVTQSGAGARVAIFYYSGNPGNIQTVTFSCASGFIAAELSEWSAAATAQLDQVGSAVSAHTDTSLTVAADAPPAATDELVITAVSTNIGGGGLTYSSPSGWSHVFADGAKGWLADYRIISTSTVPSETVSYSPGSFSVGIIATFR
jgi:hypothetical protein